MPDYYPDGRDLGENYTYTSWLMSRCIRDGKFDCIHCHTSSGRYRFATENPSGACLPCHQEKVTNQQAHTHHKPGTPGGNCIDCHMPKTRFANMNRSDHSHAAPDPGRHAEVQVARTPAISATRTRTPHGQTRKCANGTRRTISGRCSNAPRWSMRPAGDSGTSCRPCSPTSTIPTATSLLRRR